MLAWLKRIAAILTVSLLSLEMMSIGAIYLGAVPANIPNYVWPSFQPFWSDENPDFGMWHPANGHFNHVKACYNLVYRTNKFGARDKERTLRSKKSRTVVLGDSFVEGYGLARNDRVSDRLEAETGTPHLNFGTSGGFGLTQAYVLYKSLAKRFDHDRVMLFILPDNDFDDDDPEASERRGDPRFAPYFYRENGDFKLRYRNHDRQQTEMAAQRARNTALRSILRSFSFAANVLDYLKHSIMRQRSIHHKAIPSTKGYSGYYDFTAVQAERFEHVIGRLMEHTKGKMVTLVVIPRPNDLARARGNPHTPLLLTLRKLTVLYPDLRIIDLLPHFLGSSIEDGLFNTCDGHWSPAGAALATKAILRYE
ncbi:MAG: hypothetical protein CMF67_10810 [Magnetovibrio sp.]|nr:hypothetical protein [Magnetovibrio sp.]